jgi:hypothetical protein
LGKSQDTSQYNQRTLSLLLSLRIVANMCK